ncbi:hypothetical protein DY000_02034651 [Brassica cretica]|uniref:Uncharacterized protein n=1 Tax=Brassica cretica TaxID=69181 RepID=A0ABQ7DDX0_BRACR|nr:hypothetical protein DY000_02034651 [Brassica cretica]
MDLLNSLEAHLTPLLKLGLDMCPSFEVSFSDSSNQWRITTLVPTLHCTHNGHIFFLFHSDGW